MFRFNISEKHLCFIPALLLASQIYYRILFLQAAGVPEVVAFSVVPTVLASLTIGIFFRRSKLSRQARFLLHTLITTPLIASTLIQPSHLYGAELIVLCILAGMVFASIPDPKGIIPVILPALVLASLLFTPARQFIRYFNFILLPFAQFCLLGAYFIVNIPKKAKFFNGIPLLISFLMLIWITWFFIANRDSVSHENNFQASLQLSATRQNEHHFLSLLALIGQEKSTAEKPLRITVIENETLPVSRLLESIRKMGIHADITYIHPDFTRHAQRLLPFLKPTDATPAEIPDLIADADLVIVSPPQPGERSAAFLSTATFFSQIFEKLPDNGILAVYADGTPEQNLTLYHSMPQPEKKQDDTGSNEPLSFSLGKNANLYVCRKQKDLLLDGKQIIDNMPANFAGYRDLPDFAAGAGSTTEPCPGEQTLSPGNSLAENPARPDTVFPVPDPLERADLCSTAGHLPAAALLYLMEART